jgi:hypothetical protein
VLELDRFVEIEKVGLKVGEIVEEQSVLQP